MKSINQRLRYLLAALLLALFSCALALWLHKPGQRPPGLGPGEARAAVTVPASALAPQAAAVTSTNPAAALRLQAAGSFATFRLRPFSVTRESGDYQWTAEDGRDTNVIRQIVHNPMEYQRLLEENPRIFRRQLVYHRETADTLVQRARLSGDPVRQMILPGLDGQELQFEITTTDLSPSGQQGAFAGRIAGQTDSMVTFAFKGGREAFTILSPAEHLYLMGDPREPGELIVRSVEIANYVTAPCGNP